MAGSQPQRTAVRGRCAGGGRERGVEGIRATRDRQLVYSSSLLQRVPHGQEDGCACKGSYLRAGTHTYFFQVLQ